MRCGLSIWSNDVCDLYDRIQQGRGESAPLHEYVRALREGNLQRRSSVYKIENSQQRLIKGIRNYHYVTSSGRQIKVYYALEEGVYRVCEMGKVRYIKCHDGIIKDIDEREAIQ